MRVQHLIFLALLLSLAQAVSAVPSDETLLVTSYLHLSLLDQVDLHVDRMGRGLLDEQVRQITSAAVAWSGEQKAQIRKRLIASFGHAAQERFGAFVSEFTTAEAGNDPDYLYRLAERLTWAGDGPASYAELRSGMTGSHLQQDVDRAAAFLGNIQTWVDLAGKSRELPPLQAWLERDEKTPAVVRVDAVPAEEDPLAALMGQEAGCDAPPVEPTEVVSPLDNFRSMREDRSARVAAEAQAGMQMVAEERRAAEEAYAAKKLADAQAEAARVKRHAQALADVEKEALKQAENSWGNRLKRVAGATVSSAGGAFLGGIGSEAGRRAANEVFE